MSLSASLARWADCLAFLPRTASPTSLSASVTWLRALSTSLTILGSLLFLAVSSQAPRSSASPPLVGRGDCPAASWGLTGRSSDSTATVAASAVRAWPRSGLRASSPSTGTRTSAAAVSARTSTGACRVFFTSRLRCILPLLSGTNRTKPEPIVMLRGREESVWAAEGGQGARYGRRGAAGFRKTGTAEVTGTGWYRTSLDQRNATASPYARWHRREERTALLAPTSPLPGQGGAS